MRSVEDRLAILEKHAMRLRGFEAELPAELRDLPSSDEKPSEPAASGVREFSSKTHGSSAAEFWVDPFYPPTQARSSCASSGSR